MINIIKITQNDLSSILAKGNQCPVSKKFFQIGDEVVICAKCKTVFLKDAWLSQGSVCPHGLGNGNSKCGSTETLSIPKSTILKANYFSSYKWLLVFVLLSSLIIYYIFRIDTDVYPKRTNNKEITHIISETANEIITIDDLFSISAIEGYSQISKSNDYFVLTIIDSGKYIIKDTVFLNYYLNGLIDDFLTDGQGDGRFILGNLTFFIDGFGYGFITTENKIIKFLSDKQSSKRWLLQKMQ